MYLKWSDIEKEQKDVVGMLIVTAKEKIKAWKEHQEKLLNEENACNRDLKVVEVEGSYKKAFVKEVVKALNLMNTRKTAGRSGVMVDLIKVSEKEYLKNKLQMISLSSLFRSKMRLIFFLFLKPGKSSMQTGLSLFLQPNPHLV